MYYLVDVFGACAAVVQRALEAVQGGELLWMTVEGIISVYVAK